MNVIVALILLAALLAISPILLMLAWNVGVDSLWDVPTLRFWPAFWLSTGLALVGSLLNRRSNS